jgi:hypothetical protein
VDRFQDGIPTCCRRRRRRRRRGVVLLEAQALPRLQQPLLLRGGARSQCGGEHRQSTGGAGQLHRHLRHLRHHRPGSAATTTTGAAARTRSQFRGKNRRDIGKSQSIWAASKIETPGSPASRGGGWRQLVVEAARARLRARQQRAGLARPADAPPTVAARECPDGPAAHDI